MVGVTAIAVVGNGVLIDGNRPDLLFPWWSFAKTVIATAALALVRDGRLALDRPVRGRPFTLRQLLQHQAGLPDYGDLPAYHEAVERDEDPWPVEGLLERLDADRLRYHPGEGWVYSNVGYLIVRRLIEEATGQPFGSALANLVFSPLEIRNVRIACTRSDLDKIELGVTRPYHPGWAYHGLLLGPAREAAQLLERLLSGEYLPPSLLNAMTGAYPLGGAIPGRPWRRTGYGLGMMMGETRFGWTAQGHTGGGPGSVCAVYHLPGADRTVAAFAAGRTARVAECAAFRQGRLGRG